MFILDPELQNQACWQDKKPLKLFYWNDDLLYMWKSW